MRALNKMIFPTDKSMHAIYQSKNVKKYFLTAVKLCFRGARNNKTNLFFAFQLLLQRSQLCKPFFQSCSLLKTNSKSMTTFSLAGEFFKFAFSQSCKDGRLATRSAILRLRRAAACKCCFRLSNTFVQAGNFQVFSRVRKLIY